MYGAFGSGRAPSRPSIACMASTSRSCSAAGKAAEHRADLVARARVQRRERVVAPAGQGEEALPAVGLRAGALEQPALLEAAQDAAQIARIEPELSPERARGDGVLMRELVEDAPLGQGERAGQIALVQEADLPRVEAIEPPHRGDPLVGLALGHVASPLEL